MEPDKLYYRFWNNRIGTIMGFLWTLAGISITIFGLSIGKPAGLYAIVLGFLMIFVGICAKGGLRDLVKEWEEIKKEGGFE